MKIAYTGPLSLNILKAHLGVDMSVPESRLKYAHGARLVVGLLSRGHGVCVITPCESVKSVTVIESGRCRICLIPQRRSRYQLLTFHHREVQLMVKCLKDYKPDAVFAQWPYMYSRAALLSGFPTLVVGRDSPWRVARLMHTFRMWHRAVYSKLFVAPRLRHLTTISPHMVGDLERWWGCKGKISVVPNALPDGLATKQAKEIRKTAHTIACVSDWNELKNIKSLLRAFVSLRARHPDWHLVVYGCSMLPDGACGQWLRKNGYSFDGIDLRGYGKQEEIRAFLFNEADVFCSPSLEESFGMVFLEAMAQGVPCVGGEKSGAVPWVLGIDGFNHVEHVERVENPSCSPCSTRLNGKERSESSVAGGVVCDVTKPEKLAECLESLMLDGEKRKRLSLAGVKRVHEAFDITKVVKQYEKLLKGVACLN